MSAGTAAPARLLWDQGGLWSLMTLEAHEALGLPLAPIIAAEIAAGGLEGARLLVVPGGWPALKKQALGPAGARAVRDFVAASGIYLGICGGAGLALAVQDGLGLLDLGRAGGRERLPSLSGPLYVEQGPQGQGHAFWQGLSSPAVFHVWWPGQFALGRGGPVEVVCTYHGPAPGLCSADLQVDQVAPDAWPGLEAAYGIRLDSRALAGQPAVIEGRLGQGRVLLSYLHLDTPQDGPGATALGNLWQSWLGVEPRARAEDNARPEVPARAHPLARELAKRAQALWEQGHGLGLWEERLPCMPLWRRGVRGLEMWTLVLLTRALAQRSGGGGAAGYLVGQAGAALGPIWDFGPQVLASQAARQLGGAPPGTQAVRVEQAWFPSPRRVGGDLALALGCLERVLLALVRQDLGPAGLSD